MAYIPPTGNEFEKQLHVPSEVAPPTRVNEARQQASTAPGDGRVVHDNPYEEEQAAANIPRPMTVPDLSDEGSGGGKTVPFKEKVIGYAQKTRGTILRKPSLKEHGEKILQGETTHAEDRQK